jgi:hypothetical protein
MGGLIHSRRNAQICSDLHTSLKSTKVSENIINGATRSRLPKANEAMIMPDLDPFEPKRMITQETLVHD